MRPILYKGRMVQAILAGTKTLTRRLWKMPPGMGWYVSGPLKGEETGDICDLNGPGWCTVDEVRSPYGRPGDQLWVRETFFAWGRWEKRFSEKKGRDEWHFVDMTLECGESYLYAADGVSDTQAFIKRRGDIKPMWWKRPAIHMPRSASRITLEVTDVRVDRLQDISESDALAEGISTVRTPGWDAVHFPVWYQKFKTAIASGDRPPVGPLPSQAYAALWEQIHGPGSWDLNPWVWVIEFKAVKP